MSTWIKRNSISYSSCERLDRTPLKGEVEKLAIDMDNCEQSEGLSVLEHGIMVCRYFEDLYSHLTLGHPLKYEWKLPDWLSSDVLNNVMDMDIVKCYMVFHDCGKPYCLTIDEDGRRHFPDHAKVSQETWLAIGGCPTVANLIRMDMDIHLLKDVGVEDFANRKEAITLLIAGLCEIHANASMFGGIESTSFKMKWKQINKRGKKIVNIVNNKS